MRFRSMFPLFVIAAAGVSPPGVEGEPSAQQIVDEYLAQPIAMAPDAGEARGRRLHTLRLLTSMPSEAVPVVAATLPKVDLEVHREELIEVLGQLPTSASAELLVALLDDPSPAVRSQALSSLRLLAARIRRAGIADVPKGPDFPPRVEGLVQHLVEASRDEHEIVRRKALWALADTREPQAAEAIRARLADASSGIRFTAACLLTEFGDAGGLPELRAALARLTAEPGRDSPTYYFEVEHLIASFERMTGVSLGRRPSTPMALSSMTAQAESAREFDALLQAWDAWWAAHDAGEK